MYSLKAVEAACGPKLARYVENKARGGAAGQKGTRYEDLFALLKIGEAAQNAFAKDQAFSVTWNVSFRSQAICFVDDLLVYRSATRTANHSGEESGEGRLGKRREISLLGLPKPVEAREIPKHSDHGYPCSK
jgi:hypothetical protein